MVDLRALRRKIREAASPKTPLKVSRDWLEEIERDLIELATIRSGQEARP